GASPSRSPSRWKGSCFEIFVSFDHVGGIALIVARTVCHGFGALHHAQMHAITISTHAHPSAASPRQATTHSNPTTGDRQAPTAIMSRPLVTPPPVRRQHRP